MWEKGLLVDKARGRQLQGNRSMGHTYALFEDILAQLQKTLAVTRSEAGAATIASTEQPA